MIRKPLPRLNPANPVIQAYNQAVMRGQKNYHVVPHAEGWAVKRMDASKGDVYESQDRAIGVAKGYAKKDRVELFIHGRNGRIRKRNSYGND